MSRKPGILAVDESGCLYSASELCRPRSDLSESSRGDTARAAVAGSEISTDGDAVAKPKAVRTHFQDLCAGYTTDLIAEWCGVDLKTAMHYKSGTRTPGGQALTLFLLHRDGRILGAEWQGFSVRGGTLWDPYGKPLTHGQLRAYQIALQMLRECIRGNAALTRSLDELFHRAATLEFRPRDAAASGASAAPAAEAKPSALVRYRSPETIRRRNSRPVYRALDPLAEPAARLRAASKAAKD